MLGYGKIYFRVDDDPWHWGWPYIVVSVLGWIFFCDFTIYWLHRFAHSPLFWHVHKEHHRYPVPAPFAGAHYEWPDFLVIGLPYRIYAFFVPYHSMAYILTLGFAGVYVFLMHDRVGSTYSWLSSSRGHALHHSATSVNFGQYTVIWDKLFRTYQQPPSGAA
jgi:lathosterol oxidase